MNLNNGVTVQPKEITWIEVRDASGKLILKYNPARNMIEIKPKNSDVYILIKLDELRLKLGFSPEDMNVVFVEEYVVSDNVTYTVSKNPFSNNGK